MRWNSSRTSLGRDGASWEGLFCNIFRYELAIARSSAARSAANSSGDTAIDGSASRPPAYPDRVDVEATNPSEGRRVTQVTVSDRGQDVSLRTVVVRFDFATAYRDDPPICFCAAVAQIVQRCLARWLGGGLSVTTDELSRPYG